MRRLQLPRLEPRPGRPCRTLRSLRGILWGAGAWACACAFAQTPGPVKAVYQIDAGDAQALRALHHIQNHLQADPTVRIVVVALDEGVDFLLEGEKTSGGYPFELMVQQLTEKGVRFEVCNNTLASRPPGGRKVIAEAIPVQSGFAELARLQAKEGYAYLKP